MQNSTLRETLEYLGVNSKRDRAAAYPRVSDESLEDSKTLESQEKEIRRHIAKKGYNLDEEHVYPEAKTAYYKTYRQRPQFMKLLEACRRKQIDVVIVSEFSRISRKQDELAILMGLIESYGVRIESCTEQYEKTAIGKFLLSANAFASELEVIKINHRTTRGKMDRLKDGNLGGSGYPTYGYSYIDSPHETNSRYIINDVVFYTGEDGFQWTERKIVILVFQKADEGWSIRRIAIYLTELGIPTKLGKKIWSNNQVHRILTNQEYIGKAVALRWGRDEDHKVIRRPEEDHLYLPEGIIPPILVTPDGQPDIAYFERIQDKLKNNKVDSLRSNQHQDELGLLRCGYCLCGVCGYRMKVKYPRKAYGKANVPHLPEYYCRIKNGGEGRINNHGVNISLSRLDKEAWEYALTFIVKPELMREKIAALREKVTFEDNREAIEKVVKDFKRQIANLVKLAAVAQDNDTLAGIQAQVIDLERQKRQSEKSLFDEEEQAEINTKIQKAISDFEEWALRVGPRLSNPDFEVSYQEQRAAIIALGIRARVWQKADPEWFRFEVAPPKIMELMPLVSVRLYSEQRRRH